MKTSYNQLTHQIRHQINDDFESWCVKYLGVSVTSDNSSTIDIRSRLAQAMAALQKLDSLWRGKKISLATKLRLLDSNVIPIATYGCETWTILKHDMLRIQAFGHKCLRRLLGIYW